MSAPVLLGLGWTALATGFSAVTLARLLRMRTGRAAQAPAKARVLLLRPVDAPTPRELENLALPIDYAGELEQVVVSPYRPRLGPDVRWLPSDPLTPNRKVGHLLYALSVLPTEGRVVLAVDADVAVTGALVEGLVAPLLAGAALSTAAPTPVDARDGAGRAMAGLLRYTHHSFLALHAMSAGAPAVCGKALGLSTEARASLESLADHIGEDLELSKRLHARGLDVALSAAPAVVPLGEVGSWDIPLSRFTRWMRVLASHRPGLYPTVPLLFTPTVPLVLCAALLGSPVLSAAVAVLVAVRAALAHRLSVLGAPQGPVPGRGRAWTDWLLGEVLLLAAFAVSLGRQGTVTWRGRTYTLLRGGRMVRVSPELTGGPG
ncbi:glycosyltransferase [Myxococcus fulvus]|uniref:glycosyltransferase n=1 Tax=Myxococcus fulvus TaxID=33 RepID=UPI003B9944A4